MAVIRFKGFQGQRPGVHPAALAPNDAQEATSCRVDNGALRPHRAPLTSFAKTVSGTLRTLFRYTDSFWFEWNQVVHAVRSPVAGDAFARVYYTGIGVPKFTVASVATATPPYPTVSYTLGVPAPATELFVALVGSPTDPTDPAETRYYAATYVDAYGAEGPPCTPSAQIEVRPGQTVRITGILAAPAGAYNITTVRIYRLATGDTGGVYQQVVDVPVGTALYDDVIPTQSLGVVLPSLEWDPPPATMKGLVSHPGGFLIGFYDNVLCPSEVEQPHAYPLSYQLTTTDPIVGLAVFGNSVLIATTGMPEIASGNDPATLSKVDTELRQSCVSVEGIVDVGFGAVYPSPDGLVLITGGSASMLTDGIFDRDSWQALVPSSIRAYLWEGKYLAFYDTGLIQGAFSIDPQRPERGVIFYPTYATAGYNDLREDRLYLGIGNNVSIWDSGTDSTYTWRSAPIHAPAPTNFGAAQVLADAYPVDLTVYLDGVALGPFEVTSSEAIRLPAGKLAREFEVEIESDNTVYEVLLATTTSALRGV